MSNKLCHYCFQCEEDSPPDQHNSFCPNRYLAGEQRDEALANWRLGFSSTNLRYKAPEIVMNPSFLLGFAVRHPRYKENINQTPPAAKGGNPA